MKALEALASRYPQKRVLITGATSGLGEALARQFAAAGFRVAVASRNPAKIAATVAELEQGGGSALAVTLDVTRLDNFEAAAQQVGEAWNGLDILVNNAGVITAGKLEALDREVWEESLHTDLWSVIDGCRIFLPLLERSGGGHIVNVASAAGLLSGPDMATYNIAKAAVVSLSETLKVELADKNIDVTVSCPTVFKSNLMNSEGHEDLVFEGVSARGLANDMSRTSYGSDEIAYSLIRAIARRRMYNLPQLDARLNWFAARAMPETFRKVMLFLYSRRLWVFNDS